MGLVIFYDLLYNRLASVRFLFLGQDERLARNEQPGQACANPSNSASQVATNRRALAARHGGRSDAHRAKRDTSPSATGACDVRRRRTGRTTTCHRDNRRSHAARPPRYRRGRCRGSTGWRATSCVVRHGGVCHEPDHPGDQPMQQMHLLVRARCAVDPLPGTEVVPVEADSSDVVPLACSAARVAACSTSQAPTAASTAAGSAPVSRPPQGGLRWRPGGPSVEPGQQFGGHIGDPAGDRGERAHSGQHRRRTQRQNHRDWVIPALL